MKSKKGLEMRFKGFLCVLIFLYSSPVQTDNRSPKLLIINSLGLFSCGGTSCFFVSILALYRNISIIKPFTTRIRVTPEKGKKLIDCYITGTLELEDWHEILDEMLRCSLLQVSRESDGVGEKDCDMFTFVHSSLSRIIREIEKIEKE